jgi:hypothetical protein
METPDMSDFRIFECGSILAIKPVSDAARQWLNENVVTEPWQWIDGALCVEFRFARDLIAEIDCRRLSHLSLTDRPAGMQLRARLAASKPTPLQPKERKPVLGQDHHPVRPKQNKA